MTEKDALAHGIADMVPDILQLWDEQDVYDIEEFRATMDEQMEKLAEAFDDYLEADDID